MAYLLRTWHQNITLLIKYAPKELHLVSWPSKLASLKSQKKNSVDAQKHYMTWLFFSSPHQHLPAKQCCKHRLKSERRTDLATKTCFNEAEIGALYELFRKLSSSITDDGLISKEEFWIGLFRINKKQSLLADRIFQLFDFKHDGVIDFEEFVLSLNVFHPEAPQAEKVAFSFHLYDICQTGYIQQEEVKQLILALLDESDLTFPDDVIEAIIRKTFMDVDKKGDGKIDMEEWKEFVIHNPLLLKHMTVPYLKDITTTFPSFVVSPDIEDKC